MKCLPSPILHLGDRSINITLQRAFNSLTLWQTMKIVFKLIFSNKTITKEEVEQCKQKDLLEELLEQMADEYPVFRDVFVTERDIYLCHSLHVAAMPQLLESDGKPKPTKVVAVVGIGHIAGIESNWKKGMLDESTLAKILSVPPQSASFSNRAFKFGVKYGFFLLLGCVIVRKISKLRW
ncbi:traB domain-containing protein-like [Contarinia nasturtii]|uniref:traB domain-containing protein-like n=1 Tax=Contarinia nasturtii TaxID=265458 RepID=UPI0012D3F449|nr:traB domain-containing protein-like [Contarinia nasturtii]